jgi:hypothetical protein
MARRRRLPPWRRAGLARWNSARVRAGSFKESRGRWRPHQRRLFVLDPSVIDLIAGPDQVWED